MKYIYLVVRCVGMFCLLVLCQAAPGQHLSFSRENVLTKEGAPEPVKIPVAPLSRRAGVQWRQTLTFDAPLFRVHVRVLKQEAAAKWEFRVLPDSPDANHLWVKSSDDGETEFWTATISNNSTVELHSSVPLKGFTAVIDKVSKASLKVTPQAITPPDQRQPIASQPDKFREWGRSVARIRFFGDDGFSYFCSGFLIAEDVLVTNEHCMRSDAEVRSTEVDFDYDEQNAKPIIVNVRRRELTDVTLDVAIYRLSVKTGRKKLNLALVEVSEKMPLIVIQHPAGEPKQVSQTDCVVKGTSIPGTTDAKTDFGHGCDTLGGSSGSPVLNPDDGTVVGLHHLGFLPNSKSFVNQAVSAGLILTKIRQMAPDLLK